MTKSKAVKINKTKLSKAKKTRARNSGNVRMGPVSTISTAPVAIGNSVRGAHCVSRPKGDGVIVTGRDFMFSPVGSGSITTWCMVGGTPLTPAAFADSTVRQYMQMFQKYRWTGLVVHYITSSPTSANGDVMFYHGKNRDSVFLSQTSTMLLPMVISDPDTVIGPQWTNHSTRMSVQGTWKSTDYGMTSDLNAYADGEVFLLSKTSTTDSPGYIIFDYQIEFAELQITPRLLSLPLPRIQYSQTNLGLTATAVTTTTQAYASVTGNNISGTTSVIPTSCTAGDVYKVILDVTNSVVGSWVNVGSTNVWKIENSTVAAADSAISLVDGTTIYAVYGADNKFYFYANAVCAYTGGENITFGVTGTITYNLQCWLSLIGTLNSTNLSPNY